VSRPTEVETVDRAVSWWTRLAFLPRSLDPHRSCVVLFPSPEAGPCDLTVQESSHKITKHKSIPAFRLGMMMRVSVRVTFTQ